MRVATWYKEKHHLACGLTWDIISPPLCLLHCLMIFSCKETNIKFFINIKEANEKIYITLYKILRLTTQFDLKGVYFEQNRHQFHWTIYAFWRLKRTQSAAYMYQGTFYCVLLLFFCYKPFMLYLLLINKKNLTVHVQLVFMKINHFCLFVCTLL